MNKILSIDLFYILNTCSYQNSFSSNVPQSWENGLSDILLVLNFLKEIF